MTRRSIIANAASLFVFINDPDKSTYPPRTMRFVDNGVVTSEGVFEDERAWSDFLPGVHSFECVDGEWKFWER